MKTIISIILLIITSISSQHLHGRFINEELFNKPVYLYDIFQGDSQPINKTKIDLNGNFSFSTRKYDIGLYRVQAKKDKSFIVVLNPMEAEVQIQVNDKDDTKRIEVLKSLDNIAFNRHFYLLNKIYDRLESLLFKKRVHEKKTTKTSLEKEEEYQKLIKYTTLALTDLKSNYSRTFTYEILEELKPLYNDSYEDRIKQYFKSETWTNSKYLHSPLIHTKVRNYLEYYSGVNNHDMLVAIDDILMGASNNYDVYRYCLSEILLYLDRKEFNEHIEYVSSEYIGDDFDIIAKPSLRKKIEGITKLKVGVLAPDLSIPDINGNKVRLHDLYKENRINLLFFWASSCPHCIKTIPDIRNIYENYRSAGLEVIAISIDKKEEDWLSVISNENLEWTNVSSLNGWDSESTDIYFVSSTPTFYLVDNNAKIIARPDGKEDVRNLLDKLLR